jgi:hypothetical protein
MSSSRAVRTIFVSSLFLTASFVATGLRAQANEHEIARQDLFHSHDRACLIEPGEPIQIVAPLDGRLERQMREGDTVAEGALLGLYNSAALERELTLARSRQATVSTRLAQIAGPLTEAQRQLQALDIAATERKAAEALDAHERVLELAGEGRVSERRASESAEMLRQIEDELTRERMRSLIFEIETELQIAELRNSELEAQATVDKLEEQLEQFLLVSPVSGQISYADPRLTRSGVAAVQAGTHVFSVSQPHRRWARVGMTATEADRMRFGTVSVIDQDGQEFEAETLRVSMREDVAGWEKERFQFLVGFDAPQGTFLVGSEAICVFRNLAAADVLVAPLHFLVQDGDDAITLRMTADGVERVFVTTGIVDPPFIEIKGGLELGDRIRHP